MSKSRGSLADVVREAPPKTTAKAGKTPLADRPVLSLSGPANMVAAIIKVNEDHMRTE